MGSNLASIVLNVLKAVMVLINKPETWEEILKQLNNSEFVGQMMEIRKQSVSDALLVKVMKYRENPNFDYGKVSDFSMGARYMCKWVIDLTNQAKQLRNAKKRNHNRA